MNLVILIAGYLLCHRGYDRHPRSFLHAESNRLAAKIRERFGRFDESDQGRCASIIRTFMESEASKPKPATPKPDPVKQRFAEYKARQEISERLRRVVWF
jgi:hypothetical protein